MLAKKVYHDDGIIKIRRKRGAAFNDLAALWKIIIITSSNMSVFPSNRSQRANVLAVMSEIAIGSLTVTSCSTDGTVR